MNAKRHLLALAVLAAVAAPAAHAEVPIDVIAGSEISFEGLVQADGNWFDNDIVDLNGVGTTNGDDTEFELRRAELVLKGKGPGNVEWVVGYDAKADKFLDTNLKYKIGGDSNHFLQFGQFKQPNSLEELSSTKNNDFISKATVTNTYAVARRLGVAYGIGADSWGVTASAFARELTSGLAEGNGFGARGYFAPINEKGNVLHLGIAHVDFEAPSGVLRLRARPNADLATVRLIDGGNMTNVDRIATTSAEAMWITGPFKLQGEYYKAEVDRTTSADYASDGAYVSALWNVTGETWGYRGGVPTTGLPDQPGSGMWQLGLRYDTLDLNDGAVLGGKQDIWTVGANWYVRSNFKFAVNYVMVDVERGTVKDEPNILEARAQFFW